MDEVRIDKWLWAARMFKHRSRATEACGAGHVSIDGVTSKASKKIRYERIGYDQVIQKGEAEAQLRRGRKTTKRVSSSWTSAAPPTVRGPRARPAPCPRRPWTSPRRPKTSPRRPCDPSRHR